MVPAVVALGRDAAGVDPSWPPVLVAFVVGAVSVALLSIIVVRRRLRGASRDDGRRGTGRV